jgi:hypothetical protein
MRSFGMADFPFEPLVPAELLDPPQYVVDGIIAKNRLNVL